MYAQSLRKVAHISKCICHSAVKIQVMNTNSIRGNVKAVIDTTVGLKISLKRYLKLA